MAANRPTQNTRCELTVDEYCAGVRAGEVSVLARALTLVESSNPQQQEMAEQLIAHLLPHTGEAIRVGITGVPGVGKSTFIDALGMQLISDGRRVAVLAVDPSSGISGGSILGDKTRMTRLAAEPKAYIRPSPSAGTLGGVARCTRETLLVCEAAGYDVVLVETVGVGQSEVMVDDMTDCFLALMLPGAGDELQGIKRGLLEYVDVIAVNKADGSTQTAAERAAHQYALVIESLSNRDLKDGPPTVLTCSALNETGINEVWQAIEQRYTDLSNSGKLAERRSQQNLRWLWNIVEQQLQQAVREHEGVRSMREELVRDVAAGQITPRAGARRVLETLGLGNIRNSDS